MRFVDFRAVFLTLAVVCLLAGLGSRQARASLEETPSQPSTTAIQSAPRQLGSRSQEIPQGTRLAVVFQTGHDARTSAPGDIFLAQLGSDFKGAGETIILPKGTVLRGRLETVQRPGLFSRGGAMALAFDHIMLPSGELLPLTLRLSANNQQVRLAPTTPANKASATGPAGQPASQPEQVLHQPTVGPNSEETSAPPVLYADPGIRVKLRKGLDAGRSTLARFTQAGVTAGQSIAGGLGGIVTVPAAAVGGAVAGTAVTTGKAAVALVGRGDTVRIAPGDSYNLDFGGAVVLPVQN